MHDVRFPVGQDRDGWDVFEFCGQLSCHAMGENVLGEYIANFFNLRSGASGELAAELATTTDNLPAIDIQVLIGFALHRDGANGLFDYRVSKGDLLISGWGQRFHPELAVEPTFGGLASREKWSALLTQQRYGEARITERILGRFGTDSNSNGVFVQGIEPEQSLTSTAILGDYSPPYVPFKHSSGTLSTFDDLYQSIEPLVPSNGFHDGFERAKRVDTCP